MLKKRWKSKHWISQIFYNSKFAMYWVNHLLAISHEFISIGTVLCIMDNKNNTKIKLKLK